MVFHKLLKTQKYFRDPVENEVMQFTFIIALFFMTFIYFYILVLYHGHTIVLFVLVLLTAKILLI